MKKKQKGFSLIELLIVVVIIGIIAAIAIPNLLASRRSANEASAISALRTIHGAEVTFMSTNGRFANDMWELGAVKLLDETLSTPAGDGIITKSGYKYWNYRIPATSANPDAFETWVYPAVSSGISATGVNSYYINETGVIYRLTATSPSGTSPTVRIPTNGSPLNN
jgi:prepilin-type N-terminal cleavage/methylation domain-containing protein